MNKREKEREVTVSAKTVEDALIEAGLQLGLVSADIDYEVIAEGTPGFLGIGKRQAVIRAWKKKDIEGDKTDVKSDEEIDGDSVENPEKPVQEAGDTENKDRGNKDHGEREEKPNFEPILPETRTACEKFLAAVFEAMEMDVKLTSEVDEDGALNINMEGERMGLLIGKRGQTLDALQYLTNRVAGKAQGGYVRVKLDTENYRARRKETLESLARNMASKAKRTRRPVELDPMNPYERRIIHTALQDVPDITTYSRGEEPYRKVIVEYKRAR